MARCALTDEHWKKIEAVSPPPKTGPIAARGDRLVVDAALFQARTGIAWRDLPERFSPWE